MQLLRWISSLALVLALAAPVAAQQLDPLGDNTDAPPTALGKSNSARNIAKRQGVAASSPTAPAPGPFFIAPGVAMTLSYTEESAGNPVGGIKQGVAYTGQAFLGLDFDMQRLFNINGGSVHFIVTDRHGRSLSNDDIGNNTSVQELYGTQNFHLAQLTYEQKLLDNKIDFEIGRTVANVSFLASPYYCDFLSNAICGNPTFIFKNSNFTYFPASSWGSQVRYAITDKVFFHVGAYEQNPQDKSPNDNGFDFSVDKATGATIPFELGYTTDFANDPLPRHYGIGGYYDASRYTDPFLDAFGLPALLSKHPFASHFGRSGFYARFDQMVWRPDPTSQRGLTLFGVYLQNLTGQVQEDNFFALGAVQTGTFRGRDADTVGLLFTDQHFSSLFTGNIAAARMSVGASGYVPSNEFMLELNYGLQVNPYIRITPNIQGIITRTRTPSRSIPARSRTRSCSAARPTSISRPC